MRLTVNVVPRAKRTALKKVAEQTYKVWVTVAPEHGKATAKVIQLLAEYFDVAPSTITVVAGANSRKKIIEF
ncbi:MAG: hypothetical protein ACD_43C00183G0002 [uncultured bacterium]|nr:MAG: hypothetical protein ACD_43C00183G0002 [uncultured bacterium]